MISAVQAACEEDRLRCQRTRLPTPRGARTGRSPPGNRRITPPPPSKRQPPVNPWRWTQASCRTSSRSRRNHLEKAEGALLDLEANPENAEHVNGIFRAFHTIKGTSGFLALEQDKQARAQAERSSTARERARFASRAAARTLRSTRWTCSRGSSKAFARVLTVRSRKSRKGTTSFWRALTPPTVSPTSHPSPCVWAMSWYRPKAEPTARR